MESNGAATTFSGQITGSGSLTKTGTGTLVLAGIDSYSGGTTVNAGTLSITNPNAIADGSSLTVGADGTFLFDPSARALPREASPGVVVATVPEPGTLVLLAAGASLLAFAAWRQRKRV